MQNDDKPQMEGESWLDCIGEFMNKNYILSKYQQIFLEDPIFLDANDLCSTPINRSLKTSIQTQCQQPNEQFQQNLGKRAYEAMQRQDDRQQSSQQILENDVQYQEQNFKKQSLQTEKQGKVGKQSQYSKNYRQRKKQLLKTLQEQNGYLKKKINELQMRLREKQLQINRLKYAPEIKELSLEQLNQEFFKKTNLLLSKTDIDQSKTVISPQEKFYTEFMNSYDENGFGGSRKKNTLNYYFNEFLLSIMRDSEKYLFLICNSCKTPQQLKGLQSFEQIDLVFKQIMQFDEDKTQRIKHFTNNLHPFMREIKTICSDMCTDFNKILKFIEKVHNFMKASYPHNMDFSRKRIQLENWFQHNKHSKFIRRLRFEWLQSLKKQVQDQEQQKYISKNKKKKKVTQVVKENF